MAGGHDSWVQLKAAFRVLGLAGRVAAVAGALCLVILVLSLWSFGRSVVGGKAPDVAGPDDPKALIASHEAAFTKYLAQWDGRSMIIRPGAPRPTDAVADHHEAEAPRTPEKPTSYGGSDIIAMVLDTVWFADGKKLSVGDEAKDDTEVVQVLAPWEAVLRWKGVEFTVPLFQRDKLVIRPEDKPAAMPADDRPQPAAAKTEPSTPAKAEPGRVIVAKPATPDPRPPEPKSDAAPGAAPATDPPGGSGPEAESNDQSRAPAGGSEGRT
jgi:hypothetical protein